MDHILIDQITMFRLPYRFLVYSSQEYLQTTIIMNLIIILNTVGLYLLPPSPWDILGQTAGNLMDQSTIQSSLDWFSLRCTMSKVGK